MARKYIPCRQGGRQAVVAAIVLGGTEGGEEATLIYSYLLISLIKTTRLWNRSVFFGRNK